VKITDAVLEGISERWRFTPEQIRGGCRIRDLVTARHIAMYVLREAGLSYPAIAREIGHRDHTTVMHGVAKLGRFMERMSTLRPGDPMRLAIIDLVKLAQDNLEPVIGKWLDSPVNPEAVF
jgi:hypothetical protein